MCAQKVKRSLKQRWQQRGWRLTNGYWPDQLIFAIALIAVLGSIVRFCVMK